MSKQLLGNPVLRICMALAIAMMSIVVSPSRPHAANANDNFGFSNGSAAKPIRIVLSGNANDRSCGRFIGSLCISDCKYSWTRCLDIQDIFSSVEYTGTAATSKLKISYQVSIRFDGKTISLTSRGFTLVDNSTTCVGPRVTGAVGGKKVTQSATGSVCGARYGWGSIRPSKASFTVSWQYTLDGNNYTYGSSSWDQSLDYDN